jgi:diacylglycerol O-acyltransferase / wax synthase
VFGGSGGARRSPLCLAYAPDVWDAAMPFMSDDVDGDIEGELSNLAEALTQDTGVLPFEAPYTRFNGRLGPERAVAAGSWSKTRIRAIQKAAGVTGNDVVTAVNAGVLRNWLIAHGELPKRSLVAICPITVRRREHGADGDQGNMFGAGLCPLGTDLADPAERLDLIHRAMSRAKEQVASRGSGATMLLLAPSIAPTVLLPMMPFAPKLRTGYNLPISNIPGPPNEMYWNGAHIEEIYPVSTVFDGFALNVTVCSYADRLGFGYVAGRDVMPDIETLIPLTERCLAELETAVGVGP